MPEFGWWTTGRDQAALDLFETVYRATADGIVPGRISYVFSSKAPGEGAFSDAILERAERAGISVAHCSAARFEPELRRRDRETWRTAYHRKVLEAVSGFPADVVVLAGYMWVVSPEVCEKLSIINLHPAAPGGPAGTWQEVIWQLLEQEARETGVMMHLVTPELDEGPAVTFCTFSIRGGSFDGLWKEFEEERRDRGLEGIKEGKGESQSLFSAIRAEGVRRELPLIVQTLRSLALGEIAVRDGGLYDRAGRPLSGPYDLTDPIEESLRSGPE
jgi:phosphoribosylglycinamide formyltransferase-1